MARQINRRHLLNTSALAGAGFWLGTSSIGRAKLSPNEKLNVTCVGIGGQGGANLTKWLMNHSSSRIRALGMTEFSNRERVADSQEVLIIGRAIGERLEDRIGAEPPPGGPFKEPGSTKTRPFMTMRKCLAPSSSSDT